MRNKTSLVRAIDSIDLGLNTDQNNFEDNFLKIKKLPVIFQVIFLKIVLHRLPIIQESKTFTLWAITIGAQAFKIKNKGEGLNEYT